MGGRVALLAGLAEGYAQGKQQKLENERQARLDAHSDAQRSDDNPQGSLRLDAVPTVTLVKRTVPNVGEVDTCDDTCDDTGTTTWPDSVAQPVQPARPQPTDDKHLW